MDPFLTIARESEISIEIKRSKFIARSFKCPDKETALAVVKRIRETYPDATHHCWAFRVGPSGEVSRAQDDGEPHGTAGPPILSVLEQNRLTNTLIIVTRYFGGTKLGAGGLVRAYRGAAQHVLEKSGTGPIRHVKEISAVVPYAVLTPFENHASREGYEIIHKDFKQNAEIRLRVPLDEEGAFRSFYQQLVCGKYTYVVLEEKIV